MDHSTEIIDCACVIHGDAYSWTYVEHLYAMLCRNLTPRVRLHVYTEESRPVPDHMVKHALAEWPGVKAGRSWWYKMQMFDPMHHRGKMLYFDLDVVIVKNIDWIWQLPADYLWAIRDFTYLNSPQTNSINSSVMWWNTHNFEFVWTGFQQLDLAQTMLKYRGDQDFISRAVGLSQRRFFDLQRIQSWRWQCKDGGFNFKKRQPHAQGQGANVGRDTSILVFHGRPKPHEEKDTLVQAHWRL